MIIMIEEKYIKKIIKYLFYYRLVAVVRRSDSMSMLAQITFIGRSLTLRNYVTVYFHRCRTDANSLRHTNAMRRFSFYGRPDAPAKIELRSLVSPSLQRPFDNFTSVHTCATIKPTR